MYADSRTTLKLSKKLKFKFSGGPSTNRANKKTLTTPKSGNRGNGATRDSNSTPRDDQQFHEGARKGNFKAECDQKRSVRSNVRDTRFRGGNNEVNVGENFKPVNSDRKRKRIYGGQECMSDEGISNHNPRVRSRKPLSNTGEDQLKNGFFKGKNSNSSQRTMWASSRVKDATSKTRSSFNKHKDKETSSHLHDGKWRTKAKEVLKIDSVEVQDGGNGILKKHAKNKPNSANSFDQSQNKHLSFRSAKKIGLDKKSLDSEVTDERRRKKKKWGIRLDPHDISNKRLDDSIIISESEKEKRDSLEKNVEMSKNAQFRAIQPSSSILSFVEENLLGRRRLIELRRAGYNINLSAPLDNIPSDETSERMRIEENIFRNKMNFFAAAKVSSSFPPPDLPEVAFAGRSNVGKSSLLNSLTRQWGVARTSDKPGLTQSINFFELGSKLCLVDLPGYGFAYAKEEVKDAWEDLVKEYVSTRVGLRQVCLLVDTKWGLKPRDHELIELMERSQTKYQIVLTKTDIVFPIDVARRAMQIEESLKAKKSIVQPLMMVSSKSGAGIGSLRTVLAKIAQFAKLTA